MVNVNLLKSKIVEKGMNVSKVAEAMGVDKATLYRRISDCTSFTIGEAEKIVCVLNLSHEEAISIFFASNIA